MNPDHDVIFVALQSQPNNTLYNNTLYNNTLYNNTLYNNTL